MGLFNFMGGETKTAKYQLCCEVASVIRSIIQDDGYQVLMAGTFFLNDRNEVSFGKQPTAQGTKIVANAPVQIAIKNTFGTDAKSIKSGQMQDRDLLVIAIVSEFANNSNLVMEMPYAFEANKHYVSRWEGTKYSEAKIKGDVTTQVRLMKDQNVPCLIQEVHTSLGSAAVRADALSRQLNEGRTDYYQTLI